MARTSHPAGRSLAGLALRGLAVAVGTLALVLLGYSTATASAPDEDAEPAPGASLTGLVDDLTGSALDPVTDALRPVTAPVDDLVAPVVEPVRQGLEPVTRPIGGAVADVVRPAPAEAPSTGSTPVAGDDHRAGGTTSARTSTDSTPRDRASSSTGRSGSTAGTTSAAAAAARSALAADRPAPVRADTLDTVGTDRGADVGVQDLDFGEGSSLLAAWALDDLGAIGASAPVGQLTGSVHVGADLSLVAVLGDRDRTHASQSSTRPDVSPG